MGKSTTNKQKTKPSRLSSKCFCSNRKFSQKCFSVFFVGGFQMTEFHEHFLSFLQFRALCC